MVLTRGTSITFLPDHSRRQAELFFPADPCGYELRLYPVGDNRP